MGPPPSLLRRAVPVCRVLAVLAATGCGSLPPPAPAGAVPAVAGSGRAAVVPAWADLLEADPDPSVVTDVRLLAGLRATGLAWRVRDRRTGIELLLIPPGVFTMGCSPSRRAACDPAESPRHEVVLTRPFYLGRFEVTQSQWARVAGSNPSRFVGTGDPRARPVDNVSWDDIERFAAASGVRLPTEAEWEYACRAGTTAAFPNGSDDDGTIDRIAWAHEEPDPVGGYPALSPRDVGGKEANALGLHDMLGNVMEWVGDWFDAGYYAASPREDPPGPASGTHRVIRGGALAHGTAWTRSSFRNAGTPEIKGTVLGFRAAKDP